MSAPSAAFSVRPATEADLDSVIDFLAAVADEGRWIATESAFDRAHRRVVVVETLQRSDAQLFVAASPGGEVVGHLGMSARRLGLFEFGMLVAADWRGKGVGQALLSSCIAWASAADAHKIMLEVFPHNHAARALYRKFGFVEEGYFRRHLRRNNGDLWDSIPMSLVLDERPESK